MGYNWLYTSWNDNEYILFLIVIILTFIIIDFGLWKRKKDKFDNITLPQTTNPQTTSPQTTSPQTTRPQTTSSQTTQSQTTSSQTTQSQTTQSQTTQSQTSRPQTSRPQTSRPKTTQSQTTRPQTSRPQITTYQPPIITNPSNNIFVSDEEKARWRKAWVQLDGDEESLASSSNIVVQNDITQLDSTLYNQGNSNSSIKPMNYDTLGDYATIDNLGKSLTDTLGGINSNLGYTLLQEQLGTFKPNYNNPNAYDNTQSYKTGMNPDNVDGVTTNGVGKNYQLVGKNGTPIIMQKDFAGVANIFAPNIYISNPPLNSDGYPDISYSV